MTSLLEWWNFMFLLPLLSGLLLGVGIVASGAMTDLGDADANLGDVDLDIDLADVSFADYDAVSDVSGFDISNLNVDLADLSEAEASHVFAQILSFFGIGQGLPLSVLLPILLVAGGLSGLLLNGLLAQFFASAFMFVPISFGASTVISAFTGQLVARSLTSVLKAKPTAISTGGLISLTGKAVYTISDTGGVAHIKDPYGNIHRISCFTKFDEGIAANQAIQVIAFDAMRRSYLVEPAALETFEKEMK